MADDIGDQWRGGRRKPFAAVPVYERNVRAGLRIAGGVGDGLHSRRDRVRAAPRAQHARHRQRLRQIHRDNPRMGVRRANHGKMRRAGQVDIVRVNAGAAHKPRVLAPPHGIADAGFDHSFLRRAVARAVANAPFSHLTGGTIWFFQLGKQARRRPRCGGYFATTNEG